MKLLRILTLLVAAMAFTSCANKKNKGLGGSGVDGDNVNGTPLPDRQEGVSFLGGNVDRNKFAPVHFEFDSFTVPSGGYDFE